MEQKDKTSPSQLKSTISAKATVEPVYHKIPQKPSEISSKTTSHEKPIKPQSGEIKKIPSIVSPQQKEKLKQSLVDLKIKKAHLTKMTLEFDIQELKGEITPEELKDKNDKVKIMMDKIDQQIQEIENLLND